MIPLLRNKFWNNKKAEIYMGAILGLGVTSGFNWLSPTDGFDLFINT
jgi:hypothetical protein